ncbi:Pre-mRNA-splicing factor CWC26 [Meyerozyma sp. JA9]|nr:Pre-mRNA-splicing factor CWC26 [Meyerozyma sp. JA9]
MAKVDLSKYLGSGKKKKKQKTADNVVITEQPLLPTSNEVDDINEDGELAPVQISEPKKESKGFRRIDTGGIVQPQENQDTVYRDSSGRIIDIDEKRAEIERQKGEESERKEQLEKQINQGDVQRIQNEELNESIRRAQSNHLSRNDSEYNDYMKSKAHFDDPISTFVATTNTNPASKTGRPIYTKGVSPPNRFNIPAGAHWDGIDRSNGFEELVMRRRNEINAEKQNKKIHDGIDLELELD